MEPAVDVAPRLKRLREHTGVAVSLDVEAWDFSTGKNKTEVRIYVNHPPGIGWQCRAILVEGQALADATAAVLTIAERHFGLCEPA